MLVSHLQGRVARGVRGAHRINVDGLLFREYDGEGMFVPSAGLFCARHQHQPEQSARTRKEGKICGKGHVRKWFIVSSSLAPYTAGLAEEYAGAFASPDPAVITAETTAAFLTVPVRALSS